jgi:hypothetical protein
MMKCVALVALLVAAVVDAVGPFPTYVGCYVECEDTAHCTHDNRDLPVYFCSNGTTSNGCYPDSRVPDGAEWADSLVMTPAICSMQCAGFKYFGLQTCANNPGNICVCGNDYGKHGGKASEGDCNQPCKGDTSVMCGGCERNSIYAQPSTAHNTTKAK